jgi:hypothetical protein
VSVSENRKDAVREGDNVIAKECDAVPTFDCVSEKDVFVDSVCESDTVAVRSAETVGDLLSVSRE